MKMTRFRKRRALGVGVITAGVLAFDLAFGRMTADDGGGKVEPVLPAASGSVERMAAPAAAGAISPETGTRLSTSCCRPGWRRCWREQGQRESR